MEARLVSAPRQRHARAEPAAIKAGKTARQIWPDHPNKAAQKDTEARWTVKIATPELAVPGCGWKSHGAALWFHPNLWCRRRGAP